MWGRSVVTGGDGGHNLEGPWSHSLCTQASQSHDILRGKLIQPHPHQQQQVIKRSHFTASAQSRHTPIHCVSPITDDSPECVSQPITTAAMNITGSSSSTTAHRTEISTTARTSRPIGSPSITHLRILRPGFLVMLVPSAWVFQMMSDFSDRF